MKIYKKVLVEISKINSLTAEHNSLKKCYHDTEDEILKGYLREYCKNLVSAENYRRNKMISHANNVLDTNSSIKITIMNYCNQIISQGKPEWQVLAERNGWRPPIN